MSFPGASLNWWPSSNRVQTAVLVKSGSETPTMETAQANLSEACVASQSAT